MSIRTRLRSGLPTKITRAALGILAAATPAIPAGCSHAPRSQCHVSCDTTEANRHAIQHAFQRWQAGTGGPFELLAPDATWTIVGSSPASKTYHSRDQFMTEVIDPFNARLSTPLRPTVRGIYADRDAVIVFFNGEAMSRDGIAYRNTYTWYLHMHDAQITEAVAFFDTRLFDAFWDRVAPAQ